jgi:regulator of replication initiation timing
MDRDELIDEIIGLDRRLKDTQTLVFETLKPRLDELEGRVDELEAENERLRARLSESGGKEEKVAAIVRFALNKRGAADDAIKITPEEIKGATGVSRRYAYDLVDDLPDEFDWCLRPEEMQQYGAIELDLSSQAKCLGIDFAGVHSAGCPVNKFTTASEGEGSR